MLVSVYHRWRKGMDVFWKTFRVPLIALAILIHVLSMYQNSSAKEHTFATLRAGTPVLLEVMDTIDSEHYHRGQSVPLVVVRSVSVDNHIVILANSLVYAKVSKVEEASGWGGEGEISIVVESCTAVDGQEIMLSATHVAEGSSRHGSATALGVGAGVLCLPFALTGFAVKGEAGEIPAGMTIKARVDTDYKISLLTEEELKIKQEEANQEVEETKQKLEELRLKREQEEKEKRKREDTSGEM